LPAFSLLKRLCDIKKKIVNIAGAEFLKAALTDAETIGLKALATIKTTVLQPLHRPTPQSTPRVKTKEFCCKPVQLHIVI